MGEQDRALRAMGTENRKRLVEAKKFGAVFPDTRKEIGRNKARIPKALLKPDNESQAIMHDLGEVIRGPRGVTGDSRKVATRMYKEHLALVKKTDGRIRLSHARDVVDFGRMINRDRLKMLDDLTAAGMEPEDAQDVMRKP